MKGYSKPKKFNHPRYKYYVAFPNPDKTAGGRKRAYFKTLLEAEAFYMQGNAQTASAGLTVATLLESHRRAYIDAAALLKPYGVSVLAAANIYADAMAALAPYGKDIPAVVKHFKKWNTVKEESTTLERAYGLYIDDCEAKQKSPRRIADQKSRLSRFVEDMGGGQIVGLMTPAICNKWLNGLKVIKQVKAEEGRECNGQALKVETKQNVSPTTKNTYRTALSAFFSFCLMSGYVKTNPIDRVSTSMTVSEETEFYKLDDIRVMLNASPELSDIRAYLAIGAFAGLRRSELERLDYSNIDLEQRLIILPAKNTKTKQRRAVKITDNLVHWLAAYALLTRRGGKIIGKNFRRRFTAFRDSCGAKWIENGLRHSFGTYYFAFTENEYEAAKQMGNSPEVMKRNYANQLITKKQAEEYFNILPNGGVILDVKKFLGVKTA